MHPPPTAQEHDVDERIGWIVLTRPDGPPVVVNRAAMSEPIEAYISSDGCNLFFIPGTVKVFKVRWNVGKSTGGLVACLLYSLAPPRSIIPHPLAYFLPDVLRGLSESELSLPESEPAAEPPDQQLPVDCAAGLIFSLWAPG